MLRCEAERHVHAFECLAIAQRLKVIFPKENAEDYPERFGVSVDGTRMTC